MSKLIDQIKTDQKQITKRTTRLVKVLESMSRQDRIAILDAIFDNSINASSIARVLRNNGYQVGDEMVRRVRNRELISDDEIERLRNG